MNKPLILVTNDDGIHAPGIAALVSAVKDFGEVVVVAPDKPQSGQGHAITLSEPLRLHSSNIFDGIEAYECSGTPADCVKMAKAIVLKDRTIDLCVSGINHGANSSINILYSGTMSAAMEASIEGIDSIGFSLLDLSHDADMTVAEKYARIIVAQVLDKKLQACRLLNVNIPAVSENEIKGIKVCTQGKGIWVEEFVEALDPGGNKYYWMTGKYKSFEPDNESSDIWALKNGYITVVPSMHDLTKYEAIPQMRYLEKI